MVMKRIPRKSLVLGLMLSGSAQAADVVATQFKAIETDLARSEVQLEDAYSMRVGVNFVEAHRFLLHPDSRATENASSIRRELDFSLLLPGRVELGAALYDSQQAQSSEADALYGSINRDKQNLGGAIYARYHLIQSEGLRSSILVQYEPGTADRSSFHQPSQDKTGLAFAIDGSPNDYLQLGAYLGMTRRKDERFRFSRLNDEVIYGARVNSGIKEVKAFADMQVRSLPWRTAARGDTLQTGRHYEIGLAGALHDVNVQFSKYVPVNERFVGEPERGFKISVQYVFGKPRSDSKEIDDAEKILENIDEGDLGRESSAPASTLVPDAQPKAESDDDPGSLTTDVKDEGVGAMPIIKDDLPKERPVEAVPSAIQSAGTDEFQKWEKEQDLQGRRPETETERAEREYREQLAKDKATSETHAVETKTAEQIAKERLLKEMEAEEKNALESADEIEKELNQYTLPGPDETNWNGLGGK
jgi:hypothetical protein